MNTETKTCQNCKTPFTIEPEDSVFYEKMQVPAPTFCPECRMQRRMAFRNERTLYKRTCDLCKKVVIGVYPQQVPFPVYCQECWWSDRWDPFQFGRPYDFNRTFFEQYKELQLRVPRPHTNNFVGTTLVNSPFVNCSGDLKNCYLLFGSAWNEDCSYAHYIERSQNCTDVLYGIKCANCYECFDIESCYGVLFSQSCLSCRDSLFLYDCRNCTDCIGCVGLRNKQYHIFNRAYSKVAYMEEKKNLQLHTREGIRKMRERCAKELFLKFPRKYYHGQMNNGFSGDFISNCEKTYNSYYTKNTRKSKFCFWCITGLDTYDYFAWGDIELCYESVSGGENNYRCRFTETAWGDKNLEYSGLCFTSSDLFGCIGLRSKKFCILNTQYTQDEFDRIRKNIIQHMHEQPYRDAKGNRYAYGEFFPIELSPFSYADTVAQEHFPLEKSEILEKGYGWRKPEERAHAATKNFSELPASIAEVPDSLCNEIIACEHGGTCAEQCTTVFKVVPEEIAFYRKINVPVPTLCHNCRHAQRVNMRNPLKLWHRRCMCTGETQEMPESPESLETYKNTATHRHGVTPCKEEFETSYSPDRPEIVYCESCYNAEVV